MPLRTELMMPWASCIDRLATTPQEAEGLLADAVVILDGRADDLTQRGERVWEPSPVRPALLIIIDEYAELASEAPRAIDYADSIARRGRAPAVNLIAATQRPSKDAMGKSAVRSQMDVRLCFRVREPRDGELVLGQGMVKAGWHPHKLDAPGKFLISSPEHDIPRRARTYLMDDACVQATAERHAEHRPPLDEVSAQALEHAAEMPAPPSRPAVAPSPRHARDNTVREAEEALAAAPYLGLPTPSGSGPYAPGRTGDAGTLARPLRDTRSVIVRSVVRVRPCVCACIGRDRRGRTN